MKSFDIVTMTVNCFHTTKVKRRVENPYHPCIPHNGQLSGIWYCSSRARCDVQQMLQAHDFRKAVAAALAQAYIIGPKSLPGHVIIFSCDINFGGRPRISNTQQMKTAVLVRYQVSLQKTACPKILLPFVIATWHSWYLSVSGSVCPQM